MNKSEPLNNIEPVNKQIYRVLRKDIVECHIQPGKLLSEKEMAIRFDVSRQPVREAFIKLAEAGLVQVLPQRGTVVKKISERQVAESRFIRQALECAIVRRATENVTCEQLSVLESNLSLQTLAAEQRQYREFLRLDDTFHQYLTHIASYPRAWETIESIKAAMDRVRFLSLMIVSPPEMLIQQHYCIFNELKAGDPDAAEKAIHEHLQEMTYSILPISQLNNEWFE
ncbi:GntR family transcriptional regulator [Klebsiella sp. I138]|uniref:GntR family transcriptional regulator n=1 Tax=Klebsiella sp. I138 TaxID=2755385 RepID=UPI003DA92847